MFPDTPTSQFGETVEEVRTIRWRIRNVETYLDGYDLATGLPTGGGTEHGR